MTGYGAFFQQPLDPSRNAQGRRVVLLGASNLTKSIGAVLATAQGIWGQRLEVLAALGHGRSPMVETATCSPASSGILDCGISWRHLNAVPRRDGGARDRHWQRPAVRRTGGEDLPVGRRVPRSIGRDSPPVRWSRCFRLRISKEFRAAAINFFGLFFSGRRVSLDEMSTHATRPLNRHVEQAAQARFLHRGPSTGVVRIDPIHIRWTPGPGVPGPRFFRPGAPRKSWACRRVARWCRTLCICTPEGLNFSGFLASSSTERSHRTIARWYDRGHLLARGIATTIASRISVRQAPHCAPYYARASRRRA